MAYYLKMSHPVYTLALLLYVTEYVCMYIYIYMNIIYIIYTCIYILFTENKFMLYLCNMTHIRHGTHRKRVYDTCVAY
jgi:hypothetical protein